MKKILFYIGLILIFGFIAMTTTAGVPVIQLRNASEGLSIGMSGKAGVPVVELETSNATGGTCVGCYNATYESTYNSTYATYDSTYNATYSGYGSTYNETYYIHTINFSNPHNVTLQDAYDVGISSYPINISGIEVGDRQILKINLTEQRSGFWLVSYTGTNIIYALSNVLLSGAEWTMTSGRLAIGTTGLLLFDTTDTAKSVNISTLSKNLTLFPNRYQPSLNSPNKYVIVDGNLEVKGKIKTSGGFQVATLGGSSTFTNITINDSIKDANSEISFQFKNGNIYEWL